MSSFRFEEGQPAPCCRVLLSVVLALGACAGGEGDPSMGEPLGTDAGDGSGGSGTDGGGTSGGGMGSGSGGWGSSGGPALCGDGILEGDEACDDGNVMDGDGCSSTCAVEEGGLPYPEVAFAATHNSYSVERPLVGQLDLGVRMLELDIQNDSYAAEGFRIGHDGPGNQVVHGGGNPKTDALGDWLDAVVTWADDNPGHAPITFMLDLKDHLDNSGTAKGNLTALDLALDDHLGADRIFTREELAQAGDTWPGVESLRDRFVVVLTGNESTQLDYVRDEGHNPAVAVDASGRVVEVHDSGGGDLWLWTGHIEDDGSITWERHQKYDTGQKPAIALRDDGVLVEVHEDPDWHDDQLWYRTGRLGSDFEVQWFSDKGLAFPSSDSGVSPSVAFTSTGIREVHKSPGSDQHWYWSGTSIDQNGGTIDWSRPDGDGTTGDPFYVRDTFDHGGHSYQVVIASDGPFDGVLLMQIDGMPERIRYQQRMFTSVRKSSNAGLMADGPWFYAEDSTNASGRKWVLDQRRAGKVVRLWGLDDPANLPNAMINFPATDTPEVDWYKAYCDKWDCMQ